MNPSEGLDLPLCHFAGLEGREDGALPHIEHSPCLLIGSALRTFRKQPLKKNLKDSAEKVQSAAKENLL